MSRAIIISQPGEAEMLTYQEVEDHPPGPGQVAVKHTAIGINFIDIYHRKGLYPLDSDPKIPGIEAAGVIEAVGEGVEGLKEGDRVVYATAPTGSYCERRVVDSNYLIAIPEDITDKQAVAILAKGLTAHYLLYRTYRVAEKDIIMVYAAAGGVGQMLCRWASHLGAQVIGVVGSDQKKQIAMDCGCKEVINYRKEDLVARVMELTANVGVQVVYDSVGKDTFEQSIDSLMILGLLVSFGQSSGPVPPFAMSTLAPKSLFVTRPTLQTYKGNRMELLLSADEVFRVAREGVIQSKATKTYQFDEAVQAHKDIEDRRTVGSVVMMV